MFVDTALLRPNPLNPRDTIEGTSLEEMAESIRAQGILQPLLVTPDNVVIAGHRRLAAAKLAGLTQVPVAVRDMSESEQVLAMATENLQRQGLTPLQEAKAYGALRQHFGIKEMARRLGVNSNRIGGRLCILELDPAVQEMYGRDELPALLAQVLSKVNDPAKQRRLALMSARRRLSVADLERIIKQEEAVTVPAKAPEPVRRMGATRRDAVSLLERSPAKTVTHAKMAQVMDAVCGICAECGMAAIEAVCRECALPQFVKRIAK